MIAQDIMSAPVYLLDYDEPVAHARRLMVRHRISRLIVMKSSRLAGIITRKDIGYRFRNAGPVWRRRPIDQIPAGQFATADPVVISPDTRTDSIARTFMERGISGVPVTESGEVIGIVTKTDLLKSGRIQKLKMPVSDIMDDATVINRYHSVDHVIDVMSECNDKLVVANNDGTIAGVITETNLALYEPFGMRPGSEEKDVKFLRKEEPAGEKHNRYVVRATVIAEDVMTHPAITTSPGTKVSEAVEAMRQNHINSIIVAEANDIKGIVKRDAIIREVAK